MHVENTFFHGVILLFNKDNGLSDMFEQLINLQVYSVVIIYSQLNFL